MSAPAHWSTQTGVFLTHHRNSIRILPTKMSRKLLRALSTAVLNLGSMDLLWGSRDKISGVRELRQGKNHKFIFLNLFLKF